MRRLTSILVSILLIFNIVQPVMGDDTSSDPSLGEEIVIESGSAEFQATGNWANNSSLLNPSGAPSWFTTANGAKAKYNITVEAGKYDLYYWRLSHSERNDPSVDVTVSFNGKTENKTISFEGKGSEWVLLGNYYFSGDSGEYVEFGRNDSTASTVVTRTGAVKLVKTAGADAIDNLQSEFFEKELLEAIGVSEDVSISEGQPPSRADFLKMAMKATGLEGMKSSKSLRFTDLDALHPCYSVIAAAVESGIISEDDTFRPDAPVSLNEAVKILVTALGYKTPAEQAGGWTGGYVSQAIKLDLLDNMKEPFDDKAAIMMLHNALFVKPMDIVSLTELKPADEIALTKFHNIYYEKDIVYAIENINLDGGLSVKESEVRIGNKVLYDPDSIAAGYIGQRVEYYYKNDSDDTLILAKPMKGEDVVNIAARNIEDVNVSGNQITVKYSEGRSARTVSTSADAVVVYNGQMLVPPYQKNDFDIDSGSLKFMSVNKNGYNVLFVYAYDTYVVNSVDVHNEKVYAKYRPDALDLSKSNVPKYEITKNIGGKVISLDNLKEWDVLSVLKKHPSQEKGPLKISLTAKKVTGIVEAVYEDGVTIGGKDYEISDSFKPYASGLLLSDTDRLGKKITVYLGLSGEIVASDLPREESDKFVYAYKLGKKQKGADGKYILKTFTSKGEWEEIPLKDDVVFNGVKMKAVDIALRQYELVDLTWFDEATKEETVDYDVIWGEPASAGKITKSGGIAESSNAYVLGPTKKNSLYSTDYQGTVTYSASGIPAGMYGVYYYRIVYASTTTGVDVTVNHSDGTDVKTFNEYTSTAPNNNWVFVGNYNFDGVSGDVSFKLTPGATIGSSSARGVYRSAAVRFGAPVLEPKEPSDYIDKMALTIEKPIFIEKNSDGEIREIKTLTKDIGYARYAYYSRVKGFSLGTSRQKIDFTIDPSTVIFGIPKDKENFDNYNLESPASFTNESGYALEAYNLDELLNAEVVITDRETDIIDDAPQCVIVSRVSKGINSDGNFTTCIKGLGGGNEVTFVGADDDTFKEVSKGDIIIAKKNHKGDTESNDAGYRLMFAYNGRTPGQWTKSSDGTGIHNLYCIAFGTVTEVHKGGAVIKIDIGTDERMCFLSGTSVYTYEVGSDNAEVGTIGDVSVGNEIVLHYRRGAVVEAFVYK